MFKFFKSRQKEKTNIASQIMKSRLFDKNWYQSEYEHQLKDTETPLEHYLSEGEKLGNWPNPYFDPQHYESQQDAAKTEGSLLLHYAKEGWKHDLDPSQKFSTGDYLARYNDIRKSGIEPLSHYLEHGEREGRLPLAPSMTPLKGTTKDDLAWMEPLDRATRANARTIRRSGLFDENWYSKKYLDTECELSPLQHFITVGLRQGLNPNPYFSTQFYLKNYGKDIGDTPPILDYIKEGAACGREPSEYFSGNLYLKLYPDVGRSALNPLYHYLSFGRREGRQRPTNIPGSTGVPGLFDRDAELPVFGALRSAFNWERSSLNPADSFNGNALDLHWVIPDFQPGGGGHMTIFRMVHFLSVAGHKQTIWINNPSFHATEEAAFETILKFFQTFIGTVKFVDHSIKSTSGDAIIATDCFSVGPVLATTNFIRRFYFVQDFEPSFHPMGANYLLANSTYHEDLDCICASPWLQNKMEQDYGRWARSFMLAADPRLYHSGGRKGPGKRLKIAVYARHFTARRAVEFAFLALEELARRGIEFEVAFFGAVLTFDTAPFPFTDYGVASPEDLANLFRSADIGLVFSSTNYSLVPQEMMACGLPVVELDTDSTRAIFPDRTVMFAKPHPKYIADQLEKLIKDPDLRRSVAENGKKWVDTFCWKKSAKSVEAALTERLEEFAINKASSLSHTQSAKTPTAISVSAPKVSIIIPTWNAGPVLRKVLEGAVNQSCPWAIEILVIDSGSTDETIDIVKEFKSVRLHKIKNQDFDHGDTRNLGARLTTGDFIAYLTHDALPYNDRWLFNLVTSLDHFGPKAAGVFGKHFAWPDASDFTKRDLKNHFSQFDQTPLYVDARTPIPDGMSAEVWKQRLHFYSDNNSCMRRSVWEKIPYPRTMFGEDQLWAETIINAGLGKVYAPGAAVYHSHDFDEKETKERSKTESAFFKHFFGYELLKDENTLQQTLEALNAADRTWGLSQGIDQSEIDKRLKLNAARVTGLLDGARCDTQNMFQ